MIKVALISHSPAFAGAERMLFNMALLLKNSQIYEPIVFIPDSTIKNLDDACQENNIITVLMPCYAQYIFISDQNKRDTSQITLFSIENLVDIICKHEIDIMIANTATSVVAPLISVKLQIPIIGWIHGILDTYLIDPLYSNERRLFLDRMFIALCDNVICCSNWTTRYYNRYNLTPVNTLFNWSPTPKTISTLNDTANTFICLNTFDKQKGIYTLLEASAILVKTNTDFQVHFYGDGQPAVINDIQEFITKNGLKNNVKIMSRTNDIAEVYNNCLCLVQPSYIESFGMTIIEAMSYKRPVIATKAGGPEDIVIDEKTGFLIDKDNPFILAEKMKIILDNKDNAKIMGMYGEKIYHEKFSPQNAKKQIDNIIKTTLGNYKKADKNKQLYADSLMMLLKTEAKYIDNIESNLSDNPVIVFENKSRKIESDFLVFSKTIKKEKRYYIRSQNSDVSEIGIILTTFDDNIPNGNVLMNIFIEGKLLRTSKLNLNNIINNQWTYFKFTELKNADKKDMVIELKFDYVKGSSIYGVYEDMRKRTVKYKILNKLGLTGKGINILFTDCRKQ